MRSNLVMTFVIVPAMLLSMAVCATAQVEGGLGGDSGEGEPAGTDLLEGLTPEEIARIIEVAVETRLSFERLQAEAEIREGLLYDPADVTKALKILNPKNHQSSQKSNIELMYKAFAEVSPPFAKAWKLYSDKKYAEAADATKSILNPSESTYMSAAIHFIHAESLAREGRHWPAIDAYADILVNLPDRVSFASASALRAAETYEALGRGTYAMQMYAYCIENYGLTFSNTEAGELADKVEKLAELYEDPMGSVVRLMDEVQKRLARQDSGKETQQKEELVIALLEDLIKTAEEKQQNSQQNQSNSGQDKDKTKGKSGSGKNGKSGSRGAQQPTSPMKDSRLVPGKVERPTKLSTVRPSAESGDWAKLPPRERQRLQELRKKVISERYRNIISDYHTERGKGGH